MKESCPLCLSKQIVKNGMSSRGRQRLKCVACGARFQAGTAYVPKKRIPKSTVEKCVSLYNKGQSYADIGQNTGLSIQQVTGVILRHQPEKRKSHPAKQGERHNRAKLSDKDVLHLLMDYEINQLSTKQLSEKYNIEWSTARGIILGKSRTNSVEVNRYRDTITVRDERRQLPIPVAEAAKKEKILHFSLFNNEHGDVFQE